MKRQIAKLVGVDEGFKGKYQRYPGTEEKAESTKNYRALLKDLKISIPNLERSLTLPEIKKQWELSVQSGLTINQLLRAATALLLKREGTKGQVRNVIRPTSTRERKDHRAPKTWKCSLCGKEQSPEETKTKMELCPECYANRLADRAAENYDRFYGNEVSPRRGIPSAKQKGNVSDTTRKW